MDDLTLADLYEIITALEYARTKVDEYTGYPSYEFKQQRRAEVQRPLDKMRAMRRALVAAQKAAA